MRRLSIVPVVLATVIAGSFASCSDATEPEHVVQITATTPTALTGTVGAEVQPAPSVRATDENDRPLAGVAITFKVATGGGAASAGPVTTGADGSATLPKWTLGPTVGIQTLTAGAGGGADVVFTAVAAAGPVAQITPASGSNQLAGVGQGLELPLVALAADAFGNPVAGIPVVFTVTEGGGSIDGGAVVTDSAGRATAEQWRLGAEAGVQQVTATSGAARAGFRAYAVEPPGELQGQIAFISVDDEFLNLAVVNADGTGFTALPTPFFPYGLTWSPDGSLIAVTGFTALGDDNFSPTRLGFMTADGANVTWMIEGSGQWPAWSPDGTAIAYSGNGGLSSLSTTDGRVTLLVEGPSSQPSWSPDGQKIAFVRGSAFGGAADIFIANADGSAPTPLTDGDAGPGPVRDFRHPVWSPDGTMIAFVYRDEVSGLDTPSRVAVMTADGDFLKDLALAGSRSDAPTPGSLAWSPDGTGIAYSYSCSSLECAETSVRFVSLDGSRQSTLVNDARNPTWRR